MPWIEPTALVALRWGGYRERLLGGLALIIGGGTAIAGSNTVSLWLLGLGTLAHVAGWAVLPADGWRRLTAVFPSTLGCWLLLAGSGWVGVLLMPYLAWLLVRHRPPSTWLTGLFVAAAAVVIREAVPDFHGMPIALASEMAVIVLSAWLARFLHASQRISRRHEDSPR